MPDQLADVGIDHHVVADTLNSLTFVSWDRFVAVPDQLVVYGWVDPLPDDVSGRRDFVVLEFGPGAGLSYTTSSATRSEEISQVLFGTVADHVPCQRVEDHLDLVRRTCRDKRLAASREAAA